ncbi:Retrovirus-related Pol polyprotein [Stylophora pistillata]|uniref:Retrovirus-related Pol polyprotein n=1 Tax=Stylophora pistillata TaxID=50429 RepID=A0A2B4RCH1_STYPI|nr:Retrovirus-related Pol polyprotein [Stylophora pistillata]
MDKDQVKIPKGAEGGLPPDFPPEHKPEKPMKSEANEGNSDLQQLVQALKQSMMISSQVSEARRNVRAPRVYSVGQSFKKWLWQIVQYADLVRIKPSDFRAYLLTMLDQPAFKAVELLKLSTFLSFDDFTAQLIKRFDSVGDSEIPIRYRKATPSACKMFSCADAQLQPGLNSGVNGSATPIETGPSPSAPYHPYCSVIERNVGEDKQERKSDLMKHEINTGEYAPMKQLPRRIPPHKRETIDQQLDELLANEKDAMPLPRTDDVLEALGGGKWFFCLDLASWYLQMQVKEEHRPKTAFSTHCGQFQCKVMPFGLTNGPASFTRIMNQALSELTWTNCLGYLDDIIIWAPSFKEHLRRLRLVFDKIRTAGLELKPTKCPFVKREVSFLGHVVSSEGIQTDPDKVANLRTWPCPVDIKELQSFLGLASYCRRFISGFSIIAEPLYKLSRKEPQGQVVRWLERLQEYDYEIQHRPWMLHDNAEALSRRPRRRHGNGPSCTPIGLSQVAVVTRDLAASETSAGHTNQTKLKMVLPKYLVEKALVEVHDDVAGAHLGRTKTVMKMKARFWRHGKTKELLFDREMRIPLDEMVGGAEENGCSYTDFLTDLEEDLQTAYRDVRRNLDVAQ